MELLIIFALAVLLAGKSGRDHARSTRQRSGGSRMRAAEASSPGGLPPRRRSMVRARHGAGWWASEALHGFPVTSTGVHAGWLANKAAADKQRAVREEARTTHLETRAERLTGLAEHRKRQQDARDQIIAASTDPETGRAKGRKAVREAADNVVPFRPRQDPPLPSETVAPETAAASWDDPLPEPGPYAPPADARTEDSFWLNPDEPRCEECNGRGCDACRGWGNAPWDPDAPAASDDVICQACGNPARPGDPVLVQQGGALAHRSHAAESWADYEARRLTGDSTRNPSDPVSGGDMPRVPIDSSSASLGDSPGRGDRNGTDQPSNPTATGGPPMSADTTYTEVINASRAALAQSDQDTASIRTRKDDAYAAADAMVAANVDPAVINAQMEYADKLAAAEQALADAGEAAGSTASTVERYHGGMQEAVDSAPGQVAERQFHEGS
jgi:hypothetical protein